MTIKPISREDIMVWPDGTWCTRDQLSDYAWMGDDYITLAEGTIDHFNFLYSQEPKNEPARTNREPA